MRLCCCAFGPNLGFPRLTELRPLTRKSSEDVPASTISYLAAKIKFPPLRMEGSPLDFSIDSGDCSLTALLNCLGVRRGAKAILPNNVLGSQSQPIGEMIATEIRKKRKVYIIDTPIDAAENVEIKKCGREIIPQAGDACRKRRSKV